MDKQNDTAELYAAPDVLIPAEIIAKDRVVLALSDDPMRCQGPASARLRRMAGTFPTQTTGRGSNDGSNSSSVSLSWAVP
jgi:hypothetical protein